ncbi:MAG: trigger factor [bacterium]|nr:trigger factor [bacterium]
MKFESRRIESNKMVIEVTIDEVQVEQGLQTAYKKIVGKILIPGFRRGKAPRALIEQRYGVQALYDEAIDILLPQAYENALVNGGMEPIDKPEVEVVEFSKGKAAIFKFTVQLPPEVVLGQYLGVEVTKQNAEVADEQVNIELSKLQEKHTRLVESPEETVMTGDTAYIDYLGSVDGVEFEGGKAENHPLDIGSNTFIPGFEDQIVGMKRGEVREIFVTFPVQYNHALLAGKEAMFIIKLHDIKCKVLPELDDNFAKEVSEHETMEALKAEYAAKLVLTAQRVTERKVENDVVAKVVGNATVEIPEVLIAKEIDSMVEDFRDNLKRKGIPFEEYLQYLGATEEGLRTEFKESSSDRVKTRLVIDEISKLENVIVDDVELDTHLETMAKAYNQTAEQVKTALVTQGRLEAMRASLITGKTIDLLVQAAILN